MVEGSPLHYQYYPYFDPRLYPRMEVSDDLMVPNSPISTQSDSDNSLSSLEVPPTPIRVRTVIQHTPKAQVRCCWKNCGIPFDSLDQLASHVTKVHASSGPGGLFYCGWEGCSRNNKGFNARYKMLVHVRTHTNEKPHRCFQCDKSFSRAENLKIHSRSHSGEKPYVCPVPGCNKAYSNSSDRFKHTRTHQVEKPYKCKVPGCPKRYTDPSSLRKHVKTYKHFVSEAVEAPEVLEGPQQGTQQHPCNCTHMCCTSSKPSDIYRIGNLINLKNRDSFWEEKSSFYQNSMDVNVPLDLSVNRRMV